MTLKKRLFATAGLIVMASPALFTPQSVFALEASTVDSNVIDATSTAKVEKPGFSDPKLAQQMNKQILWLDFNDHKAWSNVDYIKYKETGDFNKALDSNKSYDVVTKDTLGAVLALKEGSVYRKEISRGYIVQLTVKSLKPFRASDVYRKRLEAGRATAKELATYDANATNKFKGTFGKLDSPELDKEARVVARPMSAYAQLKYEGIDTGYRRTTLASTHDGADWGVQFDVKIIRNGVESNATVVVADGEDANPGEISIFTTNGTGWEHIGEWERTNAGGHAETYKPNLVGDYLDDLLKTRSPHTNAGFYNYVTPDGYQAYWSLTGLTEGRDNEDYHYKDPYAWRFVQNPDKKTSGLGTGVFGPNISANTAGAHSPSVPIVKTDNASEVSIYVTSMGQQNAMIGFMLNDLGDAPESYGQASHAMSARHGLTGSLVKQPYLGSTKPDADTKPDASKPWTSDDKDGYKDEGTLQLASTSKFTAKRMNTGFTVTVRAYTGGLDKAYVKGWIDFNNNGKFDADEASDTVELTKNGELELTFTTNVKTLTTLEAGSRIRIAENAEEIQQPTGFAGSGEVEDQMIRLEVHTYHVDRDGEELSPVEEELTDRKVLEAYRYVETRTRENGDREHVYEKPTTTFVDTDGTTLLPPEKGVIEKKTIVGYEFVRTDVKDNGDVEHVYRQVLPDAEDPEHHENITEFVDTKGNTISPMEYGQIDKKDIPEYRYLRTEINSNEDRRHIYEKVNTLFVDKSGTSVSPKEEGTQPKKTIPEYRFVETRKKENGDTEHVYEKVITKYLDRSGTSISPDEEGERPQKDITEYKYVETRHPENGDTEHIYEKVITRHLDKTGKSISPDEEGDMPVKTITDYRYVETIKKESGDTDHIYEKVTTSFITKEGTLIIPNEEGTQPKKDITDYRFIETRKTEEGNTEHVYEKIITSHVDKSGVSISPDEEGERPHKTIDDYRFVETRKKDRGDIEHVYEKVITSFVDKSGNSISPNEEGTQPKKMIDEYRFVETRKKDNGDTEHVYEKVVTSFVDKTGKSISPNEEGTQPNKKINEYKFVETRKKDNGDTEHVYEKVITSFVDKSGTSISPNEEGAQPKKTIDDYRFIETKAKDNGDTEHVYEKVITSFIDKSGKSLIPNEEGTQPKKTIAEYRFVETRKKDNGDTEHAYEKLMTSFVDKTGKSLIPNEEGKQAKKDIDGYRFVETRNKENGDTEHVYERLVTTFVDEEGKTLLPQEDGLQDKKSISGYDFVKTVNKENGDREHVYKRIPDPQKPVTSFIDKSGKSIIPNEEGEQPKKDLPRYRFLETRKKDNGDIEHVYERVITSFVDKSGKSLIPNEEGEQPKKDIEGYNFVETRKKDNGDVEHLYEKIQPKKALPETGTETMSVFAALGTLFTGLGFGFLKNRKKK